MTPSRAKLTNPADNFPKILVRLFCLSDSENQTMQNFPMRVVKRLELHSRMLLNTAQNLSPKCSFKTPNFAVEFSPRCKRSFFVEPLSCGKRPLQAFGAVAFQKLWITAKTGEGACGTTSALMDSRPGLKPNVNLQIPFHSQRLSAQHKCRFLSFENSVSCWSECEIRLPDVV